MYLSPERVHFTGHLTIFHVYKDKMHSAFDESDMVIEKALSRCQPKFYVLCKY